MHSFFQLGFCFCCLILCSTGSNDKVRASDCDVKVQKYRSSYNQNYISCVICSFKSAGSKNIRRENLLIYTNNRFPLTNFTSINYTGDSNRDVFEEIYVNQVWSTAGGGSGVGSDKNFAAVTGHILRLVLFKYALKSILDAPCGAVSESWTKSALINLRQDLYCFRYHGVDIVRPIIRNNSISFAENKTWISFSISDISSNKAKLPLGYDLILSRDALQHLSYKHIANAIRNYCFNDALYLLVGSYLDTNINENKNILTGDCFPINLLLPPFSFPNPLEIFAENGKLPIELLKGTIPTKYLLLFNLKDLCNAKTVLNFVHDNL